MTSPPAASDSLGSASVRTLRASSSLALSWIEDLVEPVRPARDDEVEARRTPLRALADGLEQSRGGRGLVRDDEDTGRVGHGAHLQVGADCYMPVFHAAARLASRGGASPGATGALSEAFREAVSVAEPPEPDAASFRLTDSDAFAASALNGARRQLDRHR